VRRLWARHRWLVVAFAVALALTLALGLRLALRTAYWSDPERHFQKVQPWMTVGYVGRSWRLDPREIERLAGLPAPSGRPETIAQIARERGVPVGEVVAAVEAAVAGLRAAQE
jgi:hypothetical protein